MLLDDDDDEDNDDVAQRFTKKPSGVAGARFSNRPMHFEPSNQQYRKHSLAESCTRSAVARRLRSKLANSTALTI